MGDSCMWYEKRSKIPKILASGDTFCAAIVESARSVLPVMRLYAKLVFRILDHHTEYRNVTFTISTARQNPAQFEHALMETALPYHGAIRIHGKSDSSYVDNLNADLASDSTSSTFSAWTPTAAFSLYRLDLSDKVMKHLRTSGTLMKRGRYAGISRWKQRQFYCSAGGLGGDEMRVIIESERDGWPRLMWRREEDSEDTTDSDVVYKGVVVDGGTSYDVNPYYGKENCIRVTCPERSFFILALRDEERENWLSALDALFEVARARQLAAAVSNKNSLQGRWSKPFNYVLAGTQGSLQLQQSAADTRVFEFGVVNTKAPGRFYRSHIVHVTERFVFRNMCDFDINVVQDGQPSDVSSISLASRSAPKAWVWSDHRFLAQSRRIRVRLRSTMIRKSSTRQSFSPSPSTKKELGARPRTPEKNKRESSEEDYVVSSGGAKKKRVLSKTKSTLFHVGSVKSMNSTTSLDTPLFEEDEERNVDYESRWLWSEPFSVDEVGRHQLKLWRVPKYVKY